MKQKNSDMIADMILVKKCHRRHDLSDQKKLWHDFSEQKNVELLIIFN